MLWIGISLLVIGFGYLDLWATVFQKKEDGSFTFASRILHFPYRILTSVIRKLFFKTYELPQKITNNLYLGSFEMSKSTNCDTIFDLCAEYNRVNYKVNNYESFPLIDLATPTIEELDLGVKKLDDLIQKNQTVFIHCALGLSRSATIVLAWLLFSKKVSTIQDAYAFFEKNEYQSNISKNHKELLEKYFTNYLTLK
jgi:hypothetical protein